MGKADLGKGYWIVKRKLGVTMHFSEIIKLQFGENIPYIVLYFAAFLNYRCLSLFSFWIPIALAIRSASPA